MAGPSGVQKREKRVLSVEVEKRAVIKVNKGLKVDEHEILCFGANNDYPQLLEGLINSSSNGSDCVNVYASFLEGAGFENEEINNIIVGTDHRGRAMTLRSALSFAAMSTAYFQGYYFQVAVNAEGRTGLIKFKPFKNCRFSKPDDVDFSPYIVYYDNWEKDSDKKYDIKKAVKYNVFNTDKAVVAAQMSKLEEGENWRGQMFYQFLDDRYYYPLSTFDEVYLDLDNDCQMALYKNRQLRNGFFEKVFVRVSPSLAQSTDEGFDTNEGGPFGYEKDSIKEEIANFLGADGETMLVMEEDINPETGRFYENSFSIETIQGNVKTNLFESWETSSVNNIRKAAKNLPALLIDYEASSLGTTSGEAIQQATKFYNAMTSSDRAKLSQGFADLFRNTDIEGLKGNTNWNIKTLELWQ